MVVCSRASVQRSQDKNPTRSDSAITMKVEAPHRDKDLTLRSFDVQLYIFPGTVTPGTGSSVIPFVAFCCCRVSWSVARSFC